MDNGKIASTPQIVEGSSLAIIEKANIDVQVATAHQYPRSIEEFKIRGENMVCSDQETAESCIYRRPVGDGKFAEGKSIRLAEIVGACYGNLRVSAIIVEQTERYVKCRGMAHDLETNFASSCEVIESTVKSNGKSYSERMRIVVAKACLAKARRDATFQVVPAALCKTLELAARKMAIGTESTLEDRREKVCAWIKLLGIKEDRVWNVLKIKGSKEMGLNEFEILTGLKTAMSNNDITIDEAFPSSRNLKPDVSMPKAKTPDPDLLLDDETDIPPQPIPGESSEPSKSDKLFMDLKAWDGTKILEKVLKKFPNKKYPKDFSTTDLDTVLRLCASLEKKKEK